MEGFPVRKTNRLKEYDYSAVGCYFITICVRNRKEVLGRIVGDAALGVPHMELSHVGEMVSHYIASMNRQKGIVVDQYVVMPNHIHLLLRVDHETPEAAGGTPRAASPTAAMIPQAVNALKGLTSKQFGESLWQRSYHDRILRDEDEYLSIWQYIHENPQSWVQDYYYVTKAGLP